MVTCMLLLTVVLVSEALYIVSARTVFKGPYSDECGVKYGGDFRARIIGGHDAQEEAWPWQVSIKFSDPNTGITGHVCGGTLIYNDWVLTAAHCVDGRLNPGRDDPSRLHVEVGTNRITNFRFLGQTINVDRVVPHPGWVFNPMGGFPNDIALIKLVQSVPVGGAVGRACLPTTDSINLEDATCWITGWGLTNGDDPSSLPAVLQEAESPVISEASCQSRVPLPVSSSHVCVGGDGAPITCSGDSGGPLSCKVNGSWIVAGVDSWGIGSCKKYPSVMTRVSKYTSWIHTTTKN